MALKTKGMSGAMSASYSVCDAWPPHEVPVAFAAGTPTASIAAGVMKRSMHWPPSLERTRPMGTALNAIRTGIGANFTPVNNRRSRINRNTVRIPATHHINFGMITHFFRHCFTKRFTNCNFSKSHKLVINLG